MSFLDKRDCSSNCINDNCVRIKPLLVVNIPGFKSFDFSKDCDKYQRPIVKWYPKEENFFFDIIGTTYGGGSGRDPKSYLLSPAKIVNGVTRSTGDACRLAAKRMTQTNRLSALAHELEGEINFNDLGQKWYIVFCDNEAITESAPGSFHIEKVYMTKSCAELICEMINSGEVEL